MGSKSVLAKKTDEKIARLVQSGDIDLFGKLIERYEAKMIRYGRKFLSGFQDIEDVVQDIFIKAYQNIQSFDVKRKFSSWLYRIAHNEFVNALKKQKKKPLSLFELDVIFPYSLDKEVDQKIDDQKTLKNIDRYLNKLSFKYKEPFILYYTEGLSYKEIADVLRIPVSTVGIRLKRAKEKIKKKFYE